jgi:hypothetical protein
VVTQEGISTDPSKIEAVTNWPTPKNKRELRSFLGLCSYYRKFIKSFANIASPLHRLTEKETEFIWTVQCNGAFLKLKQLLTTAPILAYPIASGRYTLDTDASEKGIGAVLSQDQNGHERVIAYYSRSLTRRERNYCVTRKELLAVVKAIEKFHYYLYGQRFIVRTDHASLKWLFNFRQPEGQVARWLQKLQEYQFKVVHCAGKSHMNADVLSRRPCYESECKFCSNLEEKDAPNDATDGTDRRHDCKSNVVRSTTKPTQPLLLSWTRDELRTMQMQDPDIGPIVEWKRHSKRPDGQDISAMSLVTKSQWESIVMIDEILYRRWEGPYGKEVRYLYLTPKVI